MDAIFRLTRKLTERPLDVNFDPVAPPVLLPPSVFSPFNSQNTMFLKEAFWALLLPTSVSPRICDIWRGYWAQRLLWEINGYLAFFPPNAYQERNAHNYMKDMDDENNMYFLTDKLLAFLSHWECPVSLSFFQCVYRLSFDMAGERFWEQGDAELTKLWLEDLIRIGYNEPKRKPIDLKNNLVFKSEMGNRDFKGVRPDTKNDPSISTLERWRKRVLRLGSFATYRSATQSPPTISTEKNHNVSSVNRHTETIAKLCPGLPVLSVPTNSINKYSEGYFKDILLIIIFNWPFYGNIRFTEAIYRPIFPNILYCGSNTTLFKRDTSFIGEKVSFIEAVGIAGGQFSYWCLSQAMQMKYNVKGYMVVGDDTLINVWNFMHFDKEKIWTYNLKYIFDTTSKSGWQWWPMGVGSKAYHNAMFALKTVAKEETIRMGNVSSHRNKLPKESHINSRLPMGVVTPRQFLKQLYKNTGNVTYAVHGVSDIYYIPARLRASVVFFINHFLKHFVFNELSIPLTLYGLEEKKNFEQFSGINLWLGGRDNPWASYNFDIHFLHPLKFSKPENILPLCTAYIPALLARGHR